LTTSNGNRLFGCPAANTALSDSRPAPHIGASIAASISKRPSFGGALSFAPSTAAVLLDHHNRHCFGMAATPFRHDHEHLGGDAAKVRNMS
jgi:hypothetical protein